MRNTLKIKMLSDTAHVPTRGSDYAAGYDLYADINQLMWIPPHETVKIGTGISVEIPHGYYGAVYARSGIATKKMLRPGNAVGVIDEDYRGEVIVALHNDGDVPQSIEVGDRIAQLVINPYVAPEIEIVDELDETDRGSGGFGSTGQK